MLAQSPAKSHFHKATSGNPCYESTHTNKIKLLRIQGERPRHIIFEYAQSAKCDMMEVQMIVAQLQQQHLLTNIILMILEKGSQNYIQQDQNQLWTHLPFARYWQQLIVGESMQLVAIVGECEHFMHLWMYVTIKLNHSRCKWTMILNGATESLLDERSTDSLDSNDSSCYYAKSNRVISMHQIYLNMMISWYSHKHSQTKNSIKRLWYWSQVKDISGILIAQTLARYKLAHSGVDVEFTSVVLTQIIVGYQVDSSDVQNQNLMKPWYQLNIR